MFRLLMLQRGSRLSEPPLNTMERTGTPIAKLQNKTSIAFRKIKLILLLMIDDLVWRRRRIDLKPMFIRTENALQLFPRQFQNFLVVRLYSLDLI